MADYEKVEILLVEDNPYDAELALRAFHKNKISNNVIWLKDGSEALDFFFDGDKARIREHPRLILLDLKLPKVDGLEVLARLKTNEITCMVPVTIMTSSQEETDLIKSYRLGVNSYIVKPTDFDQLIEAVKATGSYWLVINKLPYKRG
jgi:DNA-binding response OmpR family regulator